MDNGSVSVSVNVSEDQMPTSVAKPTRSAACRDGMAEWVGVGGGRFGERSEDEAPILPSTHRQHGAARPPHVSREAAASKHLSGQNENG
jgi:hypothetical protein